MRGNVHDLLFRSTFSQVEHAAGILRHLLPPALTARLDWGSLALCPGSFVDEALGERLTDLLFSILFGGRSALLYFLLEHASRSTPLMSFRLLRYKVRIWDAWLKENPNAKQLPVILPVVLHHSPGGWKAAVSFEDLLDVDADLFETVAPYVPRFRFLLDDISAERDEDLRERSMSALGRLALLCLRHARSPWEIVTRLGAWAGLVSEVFKAPNGLAAFRTIVEYILAVNKRVNPEEVVKAIMLGMPGEVKYEVGSVAYQLVEQGRREGREEGRLVGRLEALSEGRQEGRQEGRHEGRHEERREVLLQLLRARFGELPEATVAHVKAADLDQLKRWIDRVLSAPTLEAVLKSE